MAFDFKAPAQTYHCTIYSLETMSGLCELSICSKNFAFPKTEPCLGKQYCFLCPMWKASSSKCSHLPHFEAWDLAILSRSA
jgi:hypothetical protein